jgi:ferredoxin
MTGRRLHLDPIVCDGHGLCADWLPEMIRLDDWGFPILSPDEIAPELLRRAKRAAAACPVLALKLLVVEPARS